MLSVNQLNAKFKLQEIWKAQNVDDYPFKVQKIEPKKDSITTRAMTSEKLIEVGHNSVSSKTCISDTIRLWNIAPMELRNSKSLLQVKKATNILVKTLPI